MKRCCTCGEVKETSLFNKNRSTEDGFQHRCRECQAAAHREKRIAAGLPVRGPKQTKEERLAKAREYNRMTNRSVLRRLANYDAVVAAERASRERNKDRYRPVKNARQSARNRALADRTYTILPKELRRLYEQPCAACGATERQSIDHRIPLSRGGRHSIGNLMTLCQPCNASKHARFIVEWRRAKTPVAA